MFKDRLKQLREEKKLTQKELGDKIYVSRSRNNIHYNMCC